MSEKLQSAKNVGLITTGMRSVQIVEPLLIIDESSDIPDEVYEALELANMKQHCDECSCVLTEGEVDHCEHCLYQFGKEDDEG